MTPEDLQALGKRYERAVLEADADASRDVVDEALRRGAKPLDIYDYLVVPAQVLVGTLWANGSLSVAQEHLATQLALQAIGRVRAGSRPARAQDARALVCTVEGDAHEVGARMFADLLHLDGWDVDFLGANLPIRDLVDFSLQRSPQLIGLSVSLREHVVALRRALLGLRKAGVEAPILVGGAGASGLKPTEGMTRLTVVSDLAQALLASRALAWPRDPDEATARFLSRLGARIHALRGERGLSQQELAMRAGLDRTYISAVENGKQNVSVATIGRLASALHVPLGELLVETRQP
jgi:methanogenic corrinoid protein MtbC1/DNA-binding XRE family transcriptional regulator